MPRTPRAWLTWPQRRTMPITALVGAVLAVVLLSACSPGPTTQSPAGPTGAAPAQAPAGSGAFTARTLAGNTIAVPDGKPAALFFFSVNCGTCGPGAVALAQAHQALGDKARFVAVDVAPSETDEDIRGFLTGNRAESLAFTRDTNAGLIGAYQINQLSTVVVIDPAGNEVYRGIEPSADHIQTALTQAGAR
ncbi:thioredoxin-like domain-containing protein [Saccharopolyspora sp. ID03-671]|uniref:TlpA family protein disulfide reductase n=1 Tax=Saccharopolyspora sp. ID03-671 TaxID=3073066 RepID=UPI003254998F